MVPGKELAARNALERALAAWWSAMPIAMVGPRNSRLGQNAGQRVLQATLPAIAAGVPAAVARPAEEAGWFSPLVDVASARHETAYTRLFIS